MFQSRLSAGIRIAIGLAIIAAAWQVATAVFHIPNYTLPAPSAIAAVMIKE